MEKFSIQVNGVSPLLMHSDTLVDPLDPIKKELAKLTSKRKKTDDDHEEIARIEWSAAMYYDDILGPYVPGCMIKATMIEAAKKTKEGPKVKSGLIVSMNKSRLEYEGPRDKETLWASGKYADKRSVVVQRVRVMRCRPIFNDWALISEIIFDSAIIDKSDVIRMLETAGTLIGIGDYRPQKGGDYGRFIVEEV